MSDPTSHDDPIVLRLYISGETPGSQRAIRNIEDLCETQFEGLYQLEVIDVREEPARAEQDQIMATPALVKELPPPLRKLIGDLSDRDQVLLGLELPDGHGTSGGGQTP